MLGEFYSRHWGSPSRDTWWVSLETLGRSPENCLGQVLHPQDNTSLYKVELLNATFAFACFTVCVPRLVFHNFDLAVGNVCISFTPVIIGLHWFWVHYILTRWNTRNMYFDTYHDYCFRVCEHHLLRTCVMTFVVTVLFQGVCMSSIKNMCHDIYHHCIVLGCVTVIY